MILLGVSFLKNQVRWQMSSYPSGMLPQPLKCRTKLGACGESGTVPEKQ